MNMLHEPRSCYSKPASVIITNLYDLISEIGVLQGNNQGADTSRHAQVPHRSDHASAVIECVAHMFDTGQIKFWNAQHIKRNYAELFIS